MQDDTLAGEGGESLGEELGGDVPVDEQRLGGVADARAVGLGVDGDGEGLVEVGGAVDVDVAVADPGLDDGHRGLGDDRADEVGAAARDEQVDQARAVMSARTAPWPPSRRLTASAGSPCVVSEAAQHGDEWQGWSPRLRCRRAG